MEGRGRVGELGREWVGFWATVVYALSLHMRAFCLIADGVMLCGLRAIYLSLMRPNACRDDLVFAFDRSTGTTGYSAGVEER